MNLLSSGVFDKFEGKVLTLQPRGGIFDHWNNQSTTAQWTTARVKSKRRFSSKLVHIFDVSPHMVMTAKAL